MISQKRKLAVTETTNINCQNIESAIWKKSIRQTLPGSLPAALLDVIRVGFVALREGGGT